MSQQPTQATIAAFRAYLIATIHSKMGDYLPALEDPFFLIAATGLGKTFIVPVHQLERRLHAGVSKPRIWVVEPKVAIVQDLSKDLNDLWSAFCRLKGLRHDPLFGCKTKVDHRNMDAPIIFVTTGILGIYGLNGRFDAACDSILVDEAHATLETDHAVELALALARQKGIRIDYMSASVDPEGLEQALGVTLTRALPKRYPIWMHATGKSLEDSIVEIVQGTLIQFRSDGPFAPPSGHPAGEGVAQALSEKGRTKGLLVIVPTYSSKNSEMQRVKRRLEKAAFAGQIEIAMLHGKTLRDRELKKRYLDDIARWKREKLTYVLIATSVVEMGVTLPDLDVVATTDEDFDHDEETGRAVRSPLRVNSLIQRIGRVGRVRSGLAVITNDAGARYASLDDETLNARGTLEPEKIRFPMKSGKPMHLAWHSYAEGWRDKDIRPQLMELRLPSTQRSKLPLWVRLLAVRKELVAQGFVEKGRLSDEAGMLAPWVGRFELSHVKHLVKALRELVDGDARSQSAFNQALHILAVSKTDPLTIDIAGGAAKLPSFSRSWLMYRRLIERYVCSPASIGIGVGWQWLNDGLNSEAEAFGVPANKISDFISAVDEIFEILAKILLGSSFPPSALRLIREYRERKAK